MNKVKGIITKAGEPITLLGDQIKVGDIAPDCSLVNQNGESVKLSDFNGKLLVLSIYPSIDTPVCAAQVRHFNKAASELSEEIEIIGSAICIGSILCCRRYRTSDYTLGLQK